MNLVSQTNDCSYGKLQYVPPAYDPLYPGLINGTATVTLNETQLVDGTSHGTVLDWTLAAAPEVVGPLDQYDHVMILMPGEVNFGGAAAFGYVGWKYTWYLGGYGIMTGIQMHELG